MPFPRFPRASIVAILLGFSLAGCLGPRGRRIAQHPDMLRGRPDSVQARVREGDIDLGYDRDLVFLALGQPNKIGRTPQTPADGETWTYDNFVFDPRTVMASALNPPMSAENNVGLATLLIDLVDNKVVRIRLAPDAYSPVGNAGFRSAPPAPPTAPRSTR